MCVSTVQLTTTDSGGTAALCRRVKLCVKAFCTTMKLQENAHNVILLNVVKCNETFYYYESHYILLLEQRYMRLHFCYARMNDLIITTFF